MTQTAPLPIRPASLAVAAADDAVATAPSVPMSVVVALGCALSAAWVAAGSVGLLGHSLRHVLTWVLLGAAIVAAWPRERTGVVRLAALAVAAALAVTLTASILPAVNVMAVVVVAGVLAWLAGSTGQARPLRVATGALAVFAVYRLALQGIPTVWLMADAVGRAMGAVAGWMTGQPLSVGPTFGGVDFVVLSGAFCGIWVADAPRPRRWRVAWCVVAVFVAQFAYLALLSYAPAFLRLVPEATREQPNPVWTIALPLFVDAAVKLDAVAIRQFVPDLLPVFAALFHVLAIGAIVRSSDVRVAHAPVSSRWPGALPVGAALAAAVLLPLVTTWCSPAATLEGKKIVISNKLFGNFLRPQHGDYGHLSIGMYGNLQPFIESLGGRAVISSNLADEDLKDADALVLIYPNKPFFDEELDQALRLTQPYLGFSLSQFIQGLQVERIWRYVEGGGTLLVMGEHTVADEGVAPPYRNFMNQLLAPSAIRVNFDSATFDVGGWLQSYLSFSHPITAGIEDSRNQFGVVIGASLDVKLPARPVLIGRWGFADPGDEGSSASMMGNHKYDAGERLGDLILIAEQAYGRGRVVAFGDPSNVTNGITIGAHPFNARLYSYLTHNPAKDGRGDTPQTGFRQMLGMLLAGLLVTLVCRGGFGPLGLAGLTVVMSAVLWGCSAWVAAAAEMFPDGHKMTSTQVYVDKGKVQPNYSQLAYIDNAHIGYYSEESWRPDGTMGLAMNLMRNGYLTLLAPDLKKERLDGASMLVVPAPTRAYSKAERATLSEWVENGGTLILTVGWDRYEPNRALLADFQFYLEKIPTDAFPTDVVAAARANKPGYEIIDGGVTSQGLYAFDMRNGSQAVEVQVHPESRTFYAEKPYKTPDELHQAMVTRGALGPEPLGYFKVPYIPNSQAYVRFHAAWAVRSSDPTSVVAATGRDELPVIIWRKHGSGKVILVGDSEFATNANLEHEGGEPFEGLRENADFWRWLISYYVRGEKDWWRPPPPPAPAKPNPADAFELEGK